METREIVMSEYISNCCGEPVLPDSDICTGEGCGEHCQVLELCETCKGEAQIKRLVCEHIPGMLEHFSDTVEYITCPDCDDGYRTVEL